MLGARTAYGVRRTATREVRFAGGWINDQLGEG